MAFKPQVEIALKDIRLQNLNKSARASESESDK